MLLDQFHIDVRVPRNLPEKKIAAIRRILDAAKFHAEFRRAVCAVFQKFPELKQARIRLSR
jgi:hypothetical protein